MGDEPTAYGYAYAHGLVTLASIGTDLCYDPNEPDAGRAGGLAGHGGWIRAVAGKIAISIKGRSFSVAGVIHDRGTVRVTRHGTKASLRFSGDKGKFTLSERIKKNQASWSIAGLGTNAFRSLTGVGRGTVHGSHQSLHGTVSN